jgi:SAM-dependent methyltransferase
MWLWEVAERDHDIQNPTSAEKIRLLGEYLRLTPESRVLDIACGKGGPARILAETYGCRILGIEIRPDFAEEAGRRVAEAGLAHLVEIRTGDASELELEREAWDAALCLGASFVWGTMADAAAALAPTLRHGGFAGIGEPFWRRWPVPEAIDDDGYVDLHATVARFEEAGFATTGIIAGSDDDWDRYESLHWRAVEEWLADHPDEPGAGDFRAQHQRRRDDYFAFRRALLGWAIFVGRKAWEGLAKPRWPDGTNAVSSGPPN